jgi:hypothetical protein
LVLGLLVERRDASVDGGFHSANVSARYNMLSTTCRAS